MAHTSKAYMSDHDERKDAIAWLRGLHESGAGHSDCTPAEEALCEAARILADTQHGIEGRLASVRDTKLVVFSRTEREWHRQQGIWPAELTVADVVGPCLAAFVADGASC